MSKLKPFVPTLLTFGPIFMVLGTTAVRSTLLFQIVAYVGAVMLAVGCGYLYKASKA